MKDPFSARPGEAAAAAPADARARDATARPGAGSGFAASDITASEVALRELRRLLGAWLLHEPGARLGHDPEALHQLRITVRRIDATLALFRHQLPPALAEARKTAKTVLRALGAARDLDVQIADLARYCAALPDHERSAAEPLQARLQAERVRARARMVRALDAESTRRWLETLSSASTQDVSAVAADRALIVMPERVRRRYRKLRRSVRGLHATSTMEDYHLVRRRAKQLRYAIEAGGVMFGRAAADELKALRRLQDELGAHQDAYMATRRLAGLAAAHPGNALPPATLFLMGRLAEHHRVTTTQARKTLARSWRKVRGRRWRALRAKLAELSDSAAAPRNEAPAPASAPSPVLTAVTLEPAHAPEPQPLKH